MSQLQSLRGLAPLFVPASCPLQHCTMHRVASRVGSVPNPACKLLSSRCVARRGPLRCRDRQARLRPSASATELLTAIQTGPARDVAAATFAAAGGYAFVKVFDKLTEAGVVDQKLSRKLVHMLAGPLFVLTWPLFSDEPYARFLAAIVPCINACRLVLVGTGIVNSATTIRAVSREGNRDELLRGPLYYVLILTGITAYYWRESPVGLVALSLMCGGDGLADIVGRRLGGNNRLPHNKAKSWAGSVAMFAGGFTMAMALVSLFSWLGFFECELGAVAWPVAAVALISALIESLPINREVDDNLSVPGIALLMGYFFVRTSAELL